MFSGCCSWGFIHSWSVCNVFIYLPCHVYCFFVLFFICLALGPGLYVMVVRDMSVGCGVTRTQTSGAGSHVEIPLIWLSLCSISPSCSIWACDQLDHLDNTSKQNMPSGYWLQIKLPHHQSMTQPPRLTDPAHLFTNRTSCIAPYSPITSPSLDIVQELFCSAWVTPHDHCVYEVCSWLHDPTQKPHEPHLHNSWVAHDASACCSWLCNTSAFALTSKHASKQSISQSINQSIIIFMGGSRSHPRKLWQPRWSCLCLWIGRSGSHCSCISRSTRRWTSGLILLWSRTGNPIWSWSTYREHQGLWMASLSISRPSRTFRLLLKSSLGAWILQGLACLMHRSSWPFRQQCLGHSQVRKTMILWEHRKRMIRMERRTSACIAISFLFS